LTGAGQRSKLAYVPALDGIRAVSIIFVFLFHLGKLPGGWVGVDIFFTLSGYLITSILISEHEATGSISVSNFYYRRARRLLPAVAILICVALAFSFLLGDQLHNTTVDSIAALFYVEDFRYAFWPVIPGTALVHLWSLSVEEQFYLLWPFFLIISLSAVGVRRSLYIVIAGILLVIVWRFILVSELVPSLYNRIYVSFDTRIDELLIGSALALSGHRPGDAIADPIKSLWPIIIIFFAVVLITFDPLSKWEGVSSYPLIGAAAAWLIVIVTGERINPLTKLLTLAPLVALGRISYGLYLWHYLVIYELDYFIVHKLRGSTMHLSLVAGAVTLILAIASYRLIEQPVMRLGRQAS
jgi:peptidoglycan/LPS O-acetylase OafA/YrhL